MAMKKKEPEIMPKSEIVKLFLQGLSIDMLAVRIAKYEGTGTRKAKNKAIEVIYDFQMAESRKIRGGGAWKLRRSHPRSLKAGIGDMCLAG